MDVSALRRLEEPASLQGGDPGCRKELLQTCKQAFWVGLSRMPKLGRDVCGHCHFVGTEMGLCSTVTTEERGFHCWALTFSVMEIDLNTRVGSS